MKIMIVDDHRGMREMLQSLFCGDDDEAYLCGDGAEAIEAYERWRPDWVLMDLAMQGLDGIAATRRIKAADPEARIIMVTEHFNSRFQDMARDAGACGFVAKDNLAAVREIINRAGRLPPSAGPDEPPGVDRGI